MAGAESACGILTHAHKGSEREMLRLTTQDSPAVLKLSKDATISEQRSPTIKSMCKHKHSI